MTAPDFQGPYDDFLERLNDIRTIVCAVESAYRTPGILSAIHGVDLSAIRATACNNVNFMALVFLASSFEEFVREELTECVTLLKTKYPTFPDKMRHTVRSHYWAATLSKLSYIRTILTKPEPRVPDSSIITKLGTMLDASRSFVINDDATGIDSATHVHHGNNCRPSVVDELAARVGIPNLVKRAANSVRIKTYFGVATGNAAAPLLFSKMNAFYDKRNDIVHSLNSMAGVGVPDVLDWIDLYDAFADSMKEVLQQVTAAW